MTTKYKPGEGPGRGVTRKAIIQFLMNSEHNTTIQSNIKEHLREDFGIREQKGIKKHLDNLVECGILTELEYINGKGKPYSMQKSITTLTWLIENVYDMKRLPELIKSDYYQNMIPEIIEYFDKELEKQRLPKQTDLDKKNLKIYLKYSGSCLLFIFNSDYYIKSFARFKAESEQIFDDGVSLGCLLYNIENPNIPERRYRIEKNKILDVMCKEHRINLFFNRLTTMDYYLNHITSRTFKADMRRAGDNLFKVWKQSNDPIVKRFVEVYKGKR